VTIVFVSRLEPTIYLFISFYFYNCALNGEVVPNFLNLTKNREKNLALETLPDESSKVVVLLPDIFRRMRERRNSTKTQQSGHDPKSGPAFKK